jgi:hypothetical protein
MDFVDPDQAEKQNFLQENIVKKGYDTGEFIEILKQMKKVESPTIENCTMEELREAVKKFQENFPLKNEQGGGVEMNEQIQVNKGINENNNLENVNNNILPINNEDQIENNNEDKKTDSEDIPFSRKDARGGFFNIGKDNNSSLQNNFLYDLSDNKIASRFFCFYRYGGKILTSLVLSVVNSYCGFEKLVMNDWYCFKYAMFLGCRLQPRYMAAWGWIDMNINFIDGIAGFLIRFFLFARSYTIYENIFDFFNVCIDIKVYNNLYFAVNIVGIVRSFVLLYISYEEEKRKLRAHIRYSL